MTKEMNRKTWQTPWGYPESIAVVAGVLFIGLILQLCVGSFDFYILARPANYCAGGAIFLLAIYFGLSAKRSSFARWLSGVPFSVALILAFVLLTIIMGLTPQLAEGATVVTLLGFESMTQNWAFVLLYTLTLLSLGALVVRRLCCFKLKDVGFYFNHIGLWLLLLASGLGYADMERYIMYVTEGETEWRVYDESGAIKELPVAIQLNDFDMDVYPPKLTIIDRATGEAQPADKPHYFSIDPDMTKGKLFDWDIVVEEYIHNAVRSSDSTYREVPMPGATPAIHISATKGDVSLSGWVCAGNQSQNYMTLPLTDTYSLVMTTAEPRKFSSDVEVYTERGDAISTTLEVNKPLRVGSWTIYQYGYDNNAGRLSSYSSFELVYDAWIVPVYIGVVLMMLGAITMIVTGSKTRKYGNELE